MTSTRFISKALRANLIAGVLTLIPLLVVWFVLDFIFAFLFAVGSPLARGVTAFIITRLPVAAPILTHPVFQWFVAVMGALLILNFVGAIASRMVGKRLIASVEGLIARIPIVETVYSASKKLVGMLQQNPEGAARVVLIEFPQAGMKTIGLVMRIFDDAVTGEELAAVYVPTTPNPTSGYLEIVPLRTLVQTALTMDQAMTMIVSGGAVTPDRFSIVGIPESMPSPEPQKMAPEKIVPQK